MVKEWAVLMLLESTKKERLLAEFVHWLQTADKEPLWTVWVIYCKQCGFFLPFRHPTLLKLAVGWPPAKICFFTSRFQVGIALTGCIHLCRTGAWRCVGLLLMSVWGFGGIKLLIVCGCAAAPHPSETSTDEIKSQAFCSIKPQPSCDPAALNTNTMTRDETGPDRRARGTSIIKIRSSETQGDTLSHKTF